LFYPRGVFVELRLNDLVEAAVFEWYRERAADCEELAKTSPDETAKTMPKDMAATWLRLASLLEKGELA
jgi:hypothetical protein